MKKYINAFYICATFLLIFSCTDPNLIGLEVQPPSDALSVVKTTLNTLKLSTISEDSLRSDEPSVLLLGNLNNDFIFGESLAAFATQFQLPYNNLNVGSYNDSLTVDSVILSLSYSGKYGANGEMLDITINEISESIYKDSTYYSNYSVICSNQLASLNNVIINPEDSVLVGGEMKAPHLRLNLDNSLGERILNASGTIDLENNSQFVEFFKGVYLTATTSQNGTIVYFNPYAVNTKLSVYYHSTNVDSLSVDFSLSGDAARINIFNDKSLLFEDTAFTYVQSMAGHKTVIEVKNLDTLKTFFKRKAINRVNVSFELNDSDTADYSPHGRMYLVRVDNEGKDYFLSDYIIEGEDQFGGRLENGKYTFNITRYFFQLLNNDEYTNKLYLVSSGGAINAKRTVFLKNKVKFNIIYTDL